MKLHILCIIGFALFATGCAEKEQAASERDDMSEEAPAAPAEPAAARDEAFLQHMHEHAEQLDDLNFALADDELEKAKVPAYWLSRHEEVGDIPADWQQYVVGMREAASAVEVAPDLVTARAAAEGITRQCQGCHATAGVKTE